MAFRDTKPETIIIRRQSLAFSAPKKLNQVLGSLWVQSVPVVIFFFGDMQRKTIKGDSRMRQSGDRLNNCFHRKWSLLIRHHHVIICVMKINGGFLYSTCPTTKQSIVLYKIRYWNQIKAEIKAYNRALVTHNIWHIKLYELWHFS